MAKGLAEALAGVGVLGRTMLWLAGLSTWNGADTLAWAPVASETPRGAPVWELGLSEGLDPLLARAACMFDSQKHHDPGALIGLFYS